MWVEVNLSELFPRLDSTEQESQIADFFDQIPKSRQPNLVNRLYTMLDIEQRKYYDEFLIGGLLSNDTLKRVLELRGFNVKKCGRPEILRSNDEELKELKHKYDTESDVESADERQD